MLRIALTGGIACGKSLVARYLNELGVETIDADDENGKCKIENEVAPPQFSILHSTFSIRIAVVPLLFEVQWDGEYDIICCVRSGRDTQVARMTETRGYTREEAEARLAAQLPVEEKAARSHYVIDNDGTPAELRENVARFVKWLKERQQ